MGEQPASRQATPMPGDTQRELGTPAQSHGTGRVDNLGKTTSLAAGGECQRGMGSVTAHTSWCPYAVGGT